MFRTLLVGVVALSAALFGGCSDEDIKKAEWAWVEKRKAAVEEMTGVYAGEIEMLQAGARPDASERTPTQYVLKEGDAVTRVKIRRSGTDRFYELTVNLEVIRITDESIFLSQPEVEYSFYEREKGTAYFCPGEPKFSGYIGVYDRGAKTFQVSLRVKESYNTKPQKIELDYAVLCSGKRK